MSVVAPPEPPRPDELEALIREARARQRRRLLGTAVAVAALAAAMIAANAILGGGNSKTKQGNGSTPVAGRLPSCRTSQLRLSSRPYGASAGESYADFTFTNVSSASCSLHGWPTLGFVLRGGRGIASRAHHEHNARQNGKALPPQTVRLQPHGAASFNLRIPDYLFFSAPPHCIRALAILVTPPGGRIPIRAAARGLGGYCGPGMLGVTNVVAGRLDRHMVG